MNSSSPISTAAARARARSFTQRLPILQALAWAILAAALATLFARETIHQIPAASDVWDYSQEARQMARGQGFTSLYTYPVHLDDDMPPFPVRWRMPLFPAIGSLFLMGGIALPKGYFIVAIVSHATLVALVFLLGAHLHSNRAGHIAAATAIATPLLLDPYSAGLSQVPAAALAFGAWLLLLRGGGVLTVALAAVLAALTWYMRIESVVMVPVWLWAAALGVRYARGVAAERREAAAAGADAPQDDAAIISARDAIQTRGPAPLLARPMIFLTLYAAFCLPWLLMNSKAGVQGNPALLYTPEYPAYTSMRTFGERLPDIPTYVKEHPKTFEKRILKDGAGYGVDLLWGLGALATGLALTGLLLRRPGRERWRALAPAAPLLVGAIIQIAAFSCLERSPRFLAPAIALTAVALGIVAAPALDRFSNRAIRAAFLALIILERATTVAFETREAARRFPPLPEALAAEVRQRLDAGAAPASAAAGDAGVPDTTAVTSGTGAPHGPRPGSLIWTDVPDWTSWHLDRAALLLPRWGQRFGVSAGHSVEAIFLSPAARDRNVADGEAEWVRVIERGDSISGFSGPERLQGQSLLYLPNR